MKKILFTTFISICFIMCFIMIAWMIRADYLIYFKGMDKHSILDPMKPYWRAGMVLFWFPSYLYCLHNVGTIFKK